MYKRIILKYIGRAFLFSVMMYFICSIAFQIEMNRYNRRKKGEYFHKQRENFDTYVHPVLNNSDTVTITDISYNTQFEEFGFRYTLKDYEDTLKIETNAWFDVGQQIVLDSIIKSKNSYILIY
jgi:hypothetical protein